MTEVPDARPSILFWVAAVALLLWGLATSSIYVAYFVETPAEFASTAEIPENREGYAQYIANIPWWALGAGMLAAATRVLGGVGLLVRRAWALPVYAASLGFFLIALFRAFVLADAASVMSPQHEATEVAFVLLGAFGIWFAARYRASGVLR